MLDELGQADLAEHIREEFRRRVIRPHEGAEAGVLTIGQIHKHCERKTKILKDIDQAIYQLLVCEDIVEVEKPGPGKPTRRWKWKG